MMHRSESYITGESGFPVCRSTGKGCSGGEINSGAERRRLGNARGAASRGAATEGAGTEEDTYDRPGDRGGQTGPVAAFRPPRQARQELRCPARTPSAAVDP